MSRFPKVGVDLEANSVKFTEGLSRADRALSASARKWDKGLSGIESKMNTVATSVKLGLAGIVGALSFDALRTQVYEVNKSFQDLKAGLKTATGSAQAADIAFQGIRDFARETPYDVQQITTAFIKLKNLGLDPGRDALAAYGDMAAAMPGKTMIDFVEAVADAATGEFERLKEFGIKASSEGDRVRFTFRGVTEEIGKNAGEIEKYLLRLAQNNFGGAMAEKMTTLGGKASNLKDSMDDLFVTIGEMGANDAMTAVLDALIAGTGALTDSLGTVSKVAGVAASAVGGLMVAKGVSAVYMALRVEIAAVTAGMAMMNTFGTAATARMVAMTGATTAASLAARGLSAALSVVGGPVGAGIAVLSGAVYLLATSQTQAERAADMHREAISDFNGVIDVSKGKVREMTAEVRALQKAQLEAARDASAAAVAQQETFARAGNFRIDRFAFESGMSKQDSAALFQPVRDLQRAFLDGSKSAAELYAEVSALADQDERLKPLAQSMREWAEPLIGAKSNLDDINAALAALEGNASKAQLSRLGVGDAPTSAPTAPPSGDSKRADKLRDAIEALRFEQEQLTRTNKERAVYNALKAAGLSEGDAEAGKVRALAESLYDATEAQKELNEAVEAEAKAREGLDSYIAGLRQENALLRVQGVEREKLKALTQAEEMAKEGGIDLTREQRAEIESLTESQYELAESERRVADATRDAERAAQDFGSVIGTAFEDAVLNGEKLGDVLKALEQDIARIIMRMAVTKPLESAIGSLVGGFDFGSLFSFGGGSSISKIGAAKTIKTPAFEAGGLHMGGLRLVGENGPELESTGPSRIFNAQQTQKLLSGANESASGPTVFIDARGADREGLARVERQIQALNGSIERRAVSAVADTARRGGAMSSAIRGGR